jgi:hypothetical protein
MTEQFTETVMQFNSEPHHVNVAFARHAGVYRLMVANPDFVRYMTVIADGFKQMTAVTVVLKGQEIESVSAG